MRRVGHRYWPELCTVASYPTHRLPLARFSIWVEKQWRDVLRVLKTQQDQLDYEAQFDRQGTVLSASPSRQDRRQWQQIAAQVLFIPKE